MLYETWGTKGAHLSSKSAILALVTGKIDVPNVGAYALLHQVWGQPEHLEELLARGMRLVDLDSEVRLLVVENPPVGSRPWKAPPPLRCAGRPPSCAALIGR